MIIIRDGIVPKTGTVTLRWQMKIRIKIIIKNVEIP